MRTGDTHCPDARELIEAELEKRGEGVRGLARIIATTQGGDVEKWRRPLYRLLAGNGVKEETAQGIEGGLGKPRGWLPRFDPKRQSGSLGQPADLEEVIRRTVIEVLHEVQFPRLEALEERFADLPTAADLREGLETLRAAILPAATRDTGATRRATRKASG